jgi:hypothetical protein
MPTNLQVGPVDHDPRPLNSAEQPVRQRPVDRQAFGPQVAIAYQPVGALDSAAYFKSRPLFNQVGFQ